MTLKIRKVVWGWVLGTTTKLDPWQDFGDCINYMHVVVPGDPNDASSPVNEAAFRKHLLLEFLASLRVLEYTRGYDGIYYDIRIMKRGK